MHRVLSAGGLLFFSAHNLAFLRTSRAVGLLAVPGADLIAWNLGRLPLRERNHRRLGRFERREGDYALVNDQAHDYRFLHYYISRDAQARQLAEAGFELLDCLDGDGRSVPPGRGRRLSRAPLRRTRLDLTEAGWS